MRAEMALPNESDFLIYFVSLLGNNITLIIRTKTI